MNFPQIINVPTRYRNPLGKWKVRRSAACANCLTCVGACPSGVHFVVGGKIQLPRDNRCHGRECVGRDYYCVKRCPAGALSVTPNPTYDVLGDHRWSADLLLSAWEMAETGRPPSNGLEYKIGESGGGFDRMELVLPAARSAPEEQVTTAIRLNRRQDGRLDLEIPIPVYGGGMSFGSVSIPTMQSRMRAWAALGSFCSTGEGGFPDDLTPYSDHIITQVATGLFGVREETIRRVPIVEFKYAQGAKPGLGGHLLGDKVTPAVACMREAVPGTSLFSPFPFHSVYSVEDHKKHIDWIKQVNPKALISVKVSTPTDVDMVAVGSYYAGAHIIHLDGSYGGTGAAPDIAKKNIAMPIEYAIPKVHRFLLQEGVRDELTLIVSGGIRSAHDVAKAIALGADGVVTGTADLVALECVRCHNCESGRGCPRGIATTDPELCTQIDPDWGAQRIINLFSAWRHQLVDILARLGMRSITELVGRTDCLRHLDYSTHARGN